MKRRFILPFLSETGAQLVARRSLTPVRQTHKRQSNGSLSFISGGPGIRVSCPPFKTTNGQVASILGKQDGIRHLIEPSESQKNAKTSPRYMVRRECTVRL